jgi:lysine 2,3-aminomutase
MHALSSEVDRWNDWRWQMRNRIDTIEKLRNWIVPTQAELVGIVKCGTKMRWSITPYYASLLRRDDPHCPIRKMAIPCDGEFLLDENASEDPVGDRSFAKSRRIIHKYPDRVIFLVSDSCPVYCRYCTRKFHTIVRDSTYFGESDTLDLESDLDYIRCHPEINDVLLTGGDPLSLSTRRLDHILGSLRSIAHVTLIRIGSRYPVLLPMRIDEELCETLRRHKQVYLSTHFNHPNELTSDAIAACQRLLNAGVPVLNQSVLLRGINDDVETLRTLFRGLVANGITPYYLYHCDNVSGITHFMTTLNKGRAIMAELQGYMTGFAVPRYVLTTRLGKIPVDSDHIRLLEDGVEVRNYLGQTARIRSPALVGSAA